MISTLQKHLQYAALSLVGPSSSTRIGSHLGMTSIHLDFIEVTRDPFYNNKFFNLMPRSIVAENLYAKSLKIPKCLIKELDKHDKT